jgi:hypothetical protein
LTLTTPKLGRTIRLVVGCSEACLLTAELRLARAVARSLKLPVVIGRGKGARLAAGNAAMTLTLTAKAGKALRRLRRVQLTLRVAATDAAGNTSSATRTFKAS